MWCRKVKRSIDVILRPWKFPIIDENALNDSQSSQYPAEKVSLAEYCLCVILGIFSSFLPSTKGIVFLNHSWTIVEPYLFLKEGLVFQSVFFRYFWCRRRALFGPHPCNVFGSNFKRCCVIEKKPSPESQDCRWWFHVICPYLNNRK